MDPVNLKDRKRGVELPYHYRYDYDYTVELPEGYELLSKSFTITRRNTTRLSRLVSLVILEYTSRLPSKPGSALMPR